jgi:hypothetical protein
MYTQLGHTPMKIARLYLRVSTDVTDLTRQADIEQSTRAAGYHIAGCTAKRRQEPVSTAPSC